MSNAIYSVIMANNPELRHRSRDLAHTRYWDNTIERYRDMRTKRFVAESKTRDWLEAVIFHPTDWQTMPWPSNG